MVATVEKGIRAPEQKNNELIEAHFKKNIFSDEKVFLQGGL